MSKYLHGHHESVLRSHSWRTAANSAAFLLPHLKQDSSILDIGCGPGTITVDLAQNHSPKGQVVGLETTDEIIAQANATAAKTGASNVKFVKGSVYDLPFDDDSFDVIYAHQVLQHLPDPVEAFRAMKRVVKSGGMIAVRESDYDAMFWYPETEALKSWNDIYRRAAYSLKAEPDAGRKLKVWAKQAGFEAENITSSSSNWTYSTPEEINWWSSLWADRLLISNLHETITKNGISSQEEIEKVSTGWREWGQEQDAWFCVVSGELLYRKP